MIFAKNSSFLLLLSLALLFGACKPNDDDNPVDYDRASLLSNLAQNSILPGYDTLETGLSDLLSDVNAFLANPDTAGLASLRAQTLGLWEDWQWVSAFEFGPAANLALRARMNTFPTDTLKIETNIDGGLMDLELASNIAAQGFPALDYLLWGIGNDLSEVLGYYTSDPNATERKNYLLALVTSMQSLLAQVNSAWQGTYLTNFTQDLGTSSGSPTSLLVNNLNQEFEILKNGRIGIPLGKKTLGTPLPEKTEAFYSGYSAKLAQENLRALEKLFLGGVRNGIQDSYGFDDILTDLQAAYNGGLLVDQIKTQFQNTRNALATLPDVQQEALSQTVINDPAVVDLAYVEIQQLLILLKADMPSAMGILITYQDNDGD